MTVYFVSSEKMTQIQASAENVFHSFNSPSFYVAFGEKNDTYYSADIINDR